ncbi:MAG: hypothetical protein ACYS47_10250, partial [Planctomycetota bacterium]
MSRFNRFITLLLVLAVVMVITVSCATRPPKPPPRPGYEWIWDYNIRAWVEITIEEWNRIQAEKRERERLRREQVRRVAAKLHLVTVDQLFTNPGAYKGRQVMVPIQGPISFGPPRWGKVTSNVNLGVERQLMLIAFLDDSNGRRAAVQMSNTYGLTFGYFDPTTAQFCSGPNVLHVQGVVSGQRRSRKAVPGRIVDQQSVTIQVMRIGSQGPEEGTYETKPPVTKPPVVKPPPQKPPVQAPRLRALACYLATGGDIRRHGRKHEKVTQGEVFHLYFKVANATSKRGRGAPYELRLVIMKGPQEVRNLGMRRGMAVQARAARNDMTVPQYEDASWAPQLNLSPGSYKAVLTYRDMNSGQSVQFNYPLIMSPVKGPKKKPGKGPGEKPGKGSEKKPGKGPGHKPGKGPEKKPGKGPGEKPGKGPEKKPG